MKPDIPCPQTQTPGWSQASADGSAEDTGIVAGFAEEVVAARKRLDYLMAAFAFKAHTVVPLQTGGFLVASTAWAGCHRHVTDLDALEEFARRIGACK